MRLQQTLNVEQIFAAFASASLRVGGGPDFSLENVFDLRHGKFQAQDLAVRGPFDERGVTWIGLNLHSQIGPSHRDIPTVGKLFDLETSRQGLFKGFDMIRGYDEIEIQTDQWFNEGIDALTADDTIGNSVLAKDVN